MKRAILCIALAVAPLVPASAGELVENVTTEFGTFDGVLYLRHYGRFIGSTSSGAFRMPYEIIAPADPAVGRRTVLFEPPHFAFGPIGRDVVLGRDLLFGKGFRYAAVGWSTNGLSVLDPTAEDLIIGGEPFPPGSVRIPDVFDDEILVQFTTELRTNTLLHGLLGHVSRVYAYGVSRTAGAIMEVLHGPQAHGVFDLSLIHLALWRAPFAPPVLWDHLNDEYEPVSGVGRVVFVESEADLVVSDADQFERAVGHPDYRVYEVAGAAHLPTGLNPTNHALIARAIFVAADRWVRYHIPPPPSRRLKRTTRDPDPVYGFLTGIARDADLNAWGGVQLPDVAIGRAQFIASDFQLPNPFAPGLVGTSVDLACEPRPGSRHDRPRFLSHGHYVALFARQVLELRRQRFLLADDARALLEEAIQSDVGKRGTCLR